jgi:hypothetical protein
MKKIEGKILYIHIYANKTEYCKSHNEDSLKHNDEEINYDAAK